jgi:hypothetical protein
MFPTNWTPPPNRILFIGDSITSFYVDLASRGKFPRDVEEAYHFVMGRLLGTAHSLTTDIEVVAYPGLFWRTTAASSVRRE